MTAPEVELNAELVALATAAAGARGERLEDVIERLLRTYLHEDEDGDIVRQTSE